MQTAVPIVKAMKTETKEYTNEKGEKCKDVVIHMDVLSVAKKLGVAKASSMSGIPQQQIRSLSSEALPQ